VASQWFICPCIYLYDPAIPIVQNPMDISTLVWCNVCRVSFPLTYRGQGALAQT